MVCKKGLKIALAAIIVVLLIRRVDWFVGIRPIFEDTHQVFHMYNITVEDLILR